MNTKTKERKERFGQNHAWDQQGGVNRYNAQYVWHNMARNNVPLTHTTHMRRFDKLFAT
ncbi:Uncharacterised protein [Vibrio cholerae]|nr:Uncharacterised protein [Vibrio cholerae]